MAVSSLSRIFDRSLLDTVITGTSVSRSSSSSSSSSTDAIYKSTSSLSSGLRTGARVFGAAVQNLNSATGFLLGTKDTLEELKSVVDDVVDLAKRAGQANLSKNQILTYDSEFRKLGTKFNSILTDATDQDVSSLNEEDLKEVLQSVGLDAETSESISTIFSEFTFDSDGFAASDSNVAARPIYYPKDSRYVADGTLATAVTVSTASAATSVVAADVNSDGVPDLIGHNAYLGVNYGNGDGTFTSTTTISATGSGGAIKAVDLDHDGNIDIIDSPTGASGDIRIHLGNGDGTFAVGTTIAALSQTDDLEVADLNGDGNLDIVAGVRSGSGVNNVSYFLGNGDGTFQARMTLASVAEPIGVAVADIDNDGYKDIVTTDAGSATVNIFRGDGTGSFAAALSISTGTTGPSYQFDVATADVDLDGNQDLITSSVSEPAFNVYLGNGDGTFGARTSYALAGPSVYGLAIGDLNADGRPDIVASSNSGGDGVPGGGTAVLFNGNGDGTFTVSQTFTSAGGYVYFPNIGDYTGDAVDDLAFGHGSSLTGATVIKSDTTLVSNKRPGAYSGLFDATRIVDSRSEAFALLADAKSVSEELGKNLKAVNKAISAVETNLEIARQAGLKLLDLSNQISSPLSATELSQELATAIRSRVPGASEEANNLDSVVAAALLSLENS